MLKTESMAAGGKLNKRERKKEKLHHIRDYKCLKIASFLVINAENFLIGKNIYLRSGGKTEMQNTYPCTFLDTIW